MQALVVVESVFGNIRRIARPETFRLTGTTGPLRDGEPERARVWGAVLVAQPAGPQSVQWR